MSISRIALSTKIKLLATGQEIEAYASISEIRKIDGCKFKQCYASLCTEAEGMLHLGELDLHVYDEPCQLKDPRYNFYKNEAGMILPHIHINYIENLSRAKYSHVGNALHELAFRISMQLGCEGRMTLEAVRETHYFHFINGFRSVNNLDYYLSLAKLVYDANGGRIKFGLGEQLLYLPKNVIEKKIDQFTPEIKLNVIPTETAKEAQWIENYEHLIHGAQQRSMPYQVVIALSRDFGLRVDSPAETIIDAFDRMMFRCGYNVNTYSSGRRHNAFSLMFATDQYRSQNPSLFCGKTQQILKQGISMLLELLPSYSTAKAREFAEILMGTMVLALKYQDMKYKKQQRYQNTLFYPNMKYTKLVKTHPKDIGSQIRTLGKAIITEKTISCSPAINTSFFPALAAIPGVQALLLCQAANIDTPESMTSTGLSK